MKVTMRTPRMFLLAVLVYLTCSCTGIPVMETTSNDTSQLPTFLPKEGPTIKEGDFGYTLVEHNNPYKDGESRMMQAVANKFISGQIPDTCQLDNICINGPYRTPDGSCNNLMHTSWGQSSIPFRRLLPPKVSLVQCGRLIQGLPNPRLASSVIMRRTEDDSNEEKSMYLMVFGQLLDHDMTLTPFRSTSFGTFLDCCKDENLQASDCCPIIIPRNDLFYSINNRAKCIPFIRSRLTVPPGSNCRRLPDVENSNTAFIDMSFLYGSDKERQALLRSNTGGRLMTTEDKRNRAFPHISKGKAVQMNFGDNRGDVHPAFTLVHTTFLRNHNRMADILAKAHPDWNDETIFQEVRKINIAILQNIAYTQFMDELMGPRNTVSVNRMMGQKDTYNENIDPTISLVFSTSAYRLHTYVGGSFQLRNPSYQFIGQLRLRDIFHKPLVLLENSTYDDLARGLAAQPVHDFNNEFTTEITEWLFKDANKDFGADIVALNIQRGRDHRIQGYTAYRKLCGLGEVNSWEDLNNLIPPDNIRQMRRIYQRPEDVDLYVGQNMEFTLEGSLLGPTAHCIVQEQFSSLRHGDRYFYTRPGVFNSNQLAAIQQVTLSRLICDFADDPGSMMLPANIFKLAGVSNPPIPCSDTFNIKPLDLGPWM